MTKLLHFRTLEPDDFAQVQSIGSASIPIHYPADYWQYMCDPKSIYYSLGAFDHQNNLIGVCAVIADMKEVIATRHSELEERLLIDQFEKVSYVSTCFVRSDCRGLGIGYQLIQRQKDAMIDRGSQMLYLHVLCTNTSAIKLYEKCSFTQRCRFKDYYSSVTTRPGERQDAYLYFIELKRNGGIFYCCM
ncbi:unnamed protein product, partial [Mesorhabditis spiculigera]